VRNFLPTKTNKLCTVTRLTEALMDSGAASNQSLQTDEYHDGPLRATQFTERIVFVVGGAGYVEYGNLEERSRRGGGSRVAGLLRDLGKAQT
jgi:hypothetical protein